MVLAGTDTTSTTLIWLISALLNTRHVMKHAQEELDINVGREKWVEQSDIHNRVYIQAIVNESLRLFPASLHFYHTRQWKTAVLVGITFLKAPACYSMHGSCIEILRSGLTLKSFDHRDF